MFNPVITSINGSYKEAVDLKLFIQSAYMPTQHYDFMLNIANINKMLNYIPQNGDCSLCNTISPLFKD